MRHQEFQWHLQLSTQGCMTFIVHEELIGLLYCRLNARVWETCSVEPADELSDATVGFAYYPIKWEHLPVEWYQDCL